MRLSCNKNYIARRKSAENIRTDKNKFFLEIHAKRKVKHNYSLIKIAPASVVLHYLCVRVCVFVLCVRVCLCVCVLARCSCVRYSHDKSVVRRRRTTTTIMSQMQVTLCTCIHMYTHTYVCTYIHLLCMHVCTCSGAYVHVCIAHTYTKFLNNYKNCAVPSVIVVSVRANDVAPSLSHPQDNSVHSCWRLFTPRERLRERATPPSKMESNAAKRACDC